MENEPTKYKNRRWKVKLHKYWFDRDGIRYEVLREKGNHVRLDCSEKMNTTYILKKDISKKDLFKDYTSKNPKSNEQNFR